MADDFEGVLPATAGATAWAFGFLCCSVVGSEIGDVALALLPEAFSSFRGWPKNKMTQNSYIHVIIYLLED